MSGGLHQEDEQWAASSPAAFSCQRKWFIFLLYKVVMGGGLRCTFSLLSASKFTFKIESVI